MFTAHDLDNLGKELSQDYLDNKANLTDNLAKIATTKGLNQHQTNRVAESANVELYLSLMKTAENKYINFPLADAKKAFEISQGLEKEASTVVSNDYNQPLTQVSVSEVFNKFASLEGVERSDKVILSKSKSEWLKEASACKGTIQFLTDALLETNSSFEKNYLDLKYHVKQAMLQDTSFADIKNIVFIAANPIGESLCENIQNDLKDDLKFYSFEKEAQYHASPNPESKIFKSAVSAAGNVGRHQQIDNALSHYTQKYVDIIKEAGIPNFLKKEPITNMGKFLKSIIVFPGKHPILAAAVPLSVGSYYFGKSKGKVEQGAFLEQGYAKLGPTKNPQKIFR